MLRRRCSLHHQRWGRMSILSKDGGWNQRQGLSGTDARSLRAIHGWTLTTLISERILRLHSWLSTTAGTTMFLLSKPDELPDHVESGEERFTVEWTRDDDSVSYEIVAFSRPNHFLTRFAYPMTRRLQKRFARDSVAAMKLAVARP